MTAINVCGGSLIFLRLIPCNLTRVTITLQETTDLQNKVCETCSLVYPKDWIQKMFVCLSDYEVFSEVVRESV
jgi:protein-arginine kinase activator protein McsA